MADELEPREADRECCAALAAAVRRATLCEAADKLAAEARLLKSGPSDKVRRTTLNVAAKNLRLQARRSAG